MATRRLRNVVLRTIVKYIEIDTEKRKLFFHGCREKSEKILSTSKCRHEKCSVNIFFKTFPNSWKNNNNNNKMKKKRLRTPWIHCVGGGLFKIVSSGFSPSSSSVKLIFNCPENDRANRLPRVSVTVHFRHLSNKCDELSATGVGEYDFFFKKLLTCLQNISIKV